MALFWSPNEQAHEGFDRLQALILGMRSGDALRIAEAADASGLSEHLCRRSLEALARVGVLSRELDGRFVRRRMAALAR